MAKEDKNKEEVRVIPIVWDWNERIETIYVNQVRVTHGGPEFYVYLGELPFPPIVEGEKVPDKLIVIPRIRLAISPAQMEEIVQTLSINLEKFKNKEKQEGNDVS